MERLRASPTEHPETTRPGARLDEPAILALQRTAGNQAVCRAIAGGMLARDEQADTPVSGVRVAPQKATLPLEAGAAIKASAAGSGIKWSLENGTVAAAGGTKIDESTGAVSVDAKQPGGKLKAKATNAVSWGDGEFRVIEKPKDIASTSSSTATGYEAHFKHTFNSAGAGQSGLEDANINEKFDSLTAKTPFGPDFTLTANRVGSAGWFLSSAGEMNTVDKLSISVAGVDAGPFVKNASNPAPAKQLPQGFTMTQKLHFRTFPSDKLEDAPFTTTPHERELVEKDGKLMMRIGAGGVSEHVPYAGPAVFRNAKADTATVVASGAKPAKGKWAQNEVQVSVDGEGKDAAPKFSLVGEKLGCSVDATSGLVKIGDKPGTITVRGGNAKNYDEVVITISAPPAPAAGASGATALDTGLAGADDEREPV